jgi:RNA polymerase sigma factor (sigma-70 family)
MQPPDDSELLRQYAENQSDEAFAALVARHVNLVYSVALRSAGNTHAAEEIAQAVFIILSKKAGQLRHARALSSWLFQTTRLTANNFLRSEIRRQRREQEAQDMQTILNEAEPALWPKIAPLVDGAVSDLREKDRRAILLRFYEGRNLREIGQVLGTSEDAAEKRVQRALDKLRKFFAKRGVGSTTAVIAGTISAHSVQVAPIGLAKTISAVALTKGAAVSTSTLTLIKGALKIMAWTKMKTVAVTGVAVILAAGTTGLVIKHQRQAHHPVPVATTGSGESATQSLQGHWTGSNTAHPGANCTLNIAGDEFEYRGAEPNDWVRGTFVLNEGAEPKRMDVTVTGPASESGKTIFLIYQITGNRITLAAGPHGSGQRPVDFTPGPQVDVLEFQHD